MNKLDDILEWFYWGKLQKGFTKMDAKQAILKLIRKEVVPEAKKYPEYAGAGWNACRDVMLDNLKKMEG